MIQPTRGSHPLSRNLKTYFPDIASKSCKSHVPKKDGRMEQFDWHIMNCESIGGLEHLQLKKEIVI